MSWEAFAASYTDAWHAFFDAERPRVKRLWKRVKGFNRARRAILILSADQAFVLQKAVAHYHRYITGQYPEGT